MNFEILVILHNNQILNDRNQTKTLCNLPKIQTNKQQELFNVANNIQPCYNIKVNGFTKEVKYEFKRFNETF